MSIEQYERGRYLISTAPERLDAQAIHAYLSASYWAEQIPFEVVERALRIITDHATFPYVCDVYVLPRHRGQGLGRWLMECVVRSPQLQGLRRWMLVTRDAHALYEQVGFRPLATPTGVMEIARPGMYRAEDPA